MISSKRAHVVGLGLIGSSVARALTRSGWTVTGNDLDEGVRTLALDSGVVQSSTFDPGVDLVVVATPAGAVVEVALGLLSVLSPHAVVTDVAGVKETIAHEVTDPRMVPGHPMAGSELRGLAGSRADMFEGATWVLTPTPTTDPHAYALVHQAVREMGAHVVALDAGDHDRLVALASHVPHLLAGALMNEASLTAREDAVLLQLAAGGFRDMTRIAAGDPLMWPDVLLENRRAVSATLDDLIERLRELRRVVADQDRPALESTLQSAALARRHLPGRAVSAERLAHLRVEISDRPGALATITTLASDRRVNIFDIEIAHHVEGTSGTLLLAVDAEVADEFVGALRALGFAGGRDR
ncbi:MAG: prephenate dehydrogenase/arogenate dehydrogenase family protein [Acidimicrobiaceae bacterium]|nr:prephenate dehydrogenase/arogenate dehydrogenase family protein [Acidimicrobiaceae bacterium]